MATITKQVLVDTNLLIRVADKHDQHHDDALDSLSLLKQQGAELVIVPQVLYEYRVVATRPCESNGLGMSSDQASDMTEDWLSTFRLLRDERSVFAHWQNLVRKHEVIGRTCHDARLVAAMERHQVTHLLTFNASDFKRYSGIAVLTPTDVLAA